MTASYPLPGHGPAAFETRRIGGHGLPLAVALLTVFTVAGCGALQTPVDADRLSRQALAEIARGDTSALLASADDAMRREAAADATGLQALIDSIRGFVPFDSLPLVGWQTTSMNGSAEANLSYEVGRGSHWGVVTISTRGRGAGLQLVGLNYQPLSSSLETMNAFSISNKPVGQILMLALAVIAALFSLGTSIVVAVSKRRKRFRWAFLSLLGFGTVSVNWTTGAVQVAMFNVELLAAGIVKGGVYAPWFVSVSVPVGAVAALGWLRRRGGVQDPPPSAEEAGGGSGVMD
jgi:hypothetical protein